LEVRRSHEAEALFGSKSGRGCIYFGVLQKTGNEDECSDSEKREGFIGPKFQLRLEAKVLGMERIERRTDDQRRDATVLYYANRMSQICTM
jgi:hypothetical protein